MGDDIKGLSKKFLENNFGLIPSIRKTYKKGSLEQFVAFMSKCEPDNGWSCEKISVDTEFDVDCIENDNDW